MLIELPYKACPELYFGRFAWVTLSEVERVRWCEKRTSSLASGEAVHSITGCPFLYDCQPDFSTKSRLKNFKQGRELNVSFAVFKS